MMVPLKNIYIIRDDNKKGCSLQIKSRKVEGNRQKQFLLNIVIVWFPKYQLFRNTIC